MLIADNGEHLRAMRLLPLFGVEGLQVTDVQAGPGGVLEV
jgi:hypothetical protein